MQLFVGQSSGRGSIKRYSLDFLEMPVSSSMPKPRTLREMREARPNLRFALRLHPDVALASAAHEDVARAAAAAEALKADVVVVATGPRFTPTTSNRRNLTELSAALTREGTSVAWEPRGVWVPKEAENWAEEAKMILVRDLTREFAPPGPVIYTRILPFGMGARMSQSGREHLAEQLENAEAAYVVAPAEGAKTTRTELRDWLELEGD